MIKVLFVKQSGVQKPFKQTGRIPKSCKSRRILNTNKMKRTLFIFFSIIVFTAMSCTEDYSDPKVLSGTTWRCSSFPAISDYDYLEYVELQFISTSQVASWDKPKNGSIFKEDIIGSYTISNKTITIYVQSGNSVTITGVIENKKMTLLIPQSNTTLIFIKQ
jgi:hypothetical protein